MSAVNYDAMYQAMVRDVHGAQFHPLSEKRRGPGRRKSPRSGIAYPSIPSSFAAVPPRILIRSSSLSPGIDMTWSTGAVFHGNG